MRSAGSNAITTLCRGRRTTLTGTPWHILYIKANYCTTQAKKSFFLPPHKYNLSCWYVCLVLSTWWKSEKQTLAQSCGLCTLISWTIKLCQYRDLNLQYHPPLHQQGACAPRRTHRHGLRPGQAELQVSLLRGAAGGGPQPAAVPRIPPAGGGQHGHWEELLAPGPQQTLGAN